MVRVSREGSVHGFGLVDVLGFWEGWERGEGSSGRPLVGCLALYWDVNWGSWKLTGFVEVWHLVLGGIMK